VEALDVAVGELYFQAESLESAHAALEIERRAYQEFFDGGPDGYLVTDPDGVILRANARAGEFFRCGIEDLAGEMLADLIRSENRASFRRLLEGFEAAAPEGEWVGQAVPAASRPFTVALTATVVRHADRTPYRVRWSVRDISLRPALD
jgi:PAS domain S-box-containing protein